MVTGSGAYRVLGRYRQRRRSKGRQRRRQRGGAPCFYAGRGSGDAFSPNGVIAGNRGRAVGGWISEQRRGNACPLRVAVDMRKQRFYSRHQRLPVEQFADRGRFGESGGIARTVSTRAKIGIEIGGRGNAAGERARARFRQSRF